VTLVLLSTVPSAGVGGTAGTTTQEHDVTVVDECRTIDSPGHYRLGRDIETTQDTCIRITASDVVFDGGGHHINNTNLDEFRDLGRLNGDAVLVGGNTAVSNVTVRDVTGATWGTLVQLENVTGAEVAGVEMPAGAGEDYRRVTTGISIAHSTNVSAHDSTLQESTIAAAFQVVHASNVRISNNTIANIDYYDTNYGSAEGLVVDTATGVTIVNNTFVDAPGGPFGEKGLEVTDSADVRLARNTFEDSVAALGSNTTFLHNTVRDSGIQIHGQDSHVASNTFTSAGLGASGSNVTVAGNAFTDGSSVSIEETPDTTGATDLADSNDSTDTSSAAVSVVRNEFENHSGVIVRDGDVAVRNNTITGGHDGRGIYVSDGQNVTVSANTIQNTRQGISIGDAAVTVTNNLLTDNEAGVHLRYLGVDVTLVANDIRGNEVGLSIENGSATRCINVNRVDVHQNDFSNNSRYAIENEDVRVVNATNNYWGAENGPSSATAEPLADPQTGTLADGDGAAVSASPTEPGVANVRFDPWLAQDPTTVDGNASA